MASRIEQLSHSIPIRLTPEERSLQKLLCSALDVSEYTNRVDTYAHRRNETILSELYELYQTMLGLNVNASSSSGKKLLMDIFKNAKTREEAFSSKECQKWIRTVFEIGRRYKRMNPDKMRTEYGKLISIMQDAVDSSATTRVEVNIPVISVASVLESHSLTSVFNDEDIISATRPIADTADMEQAMRDKEATIKALVQRHAADDKDKQAALELSLRSLDDGNCVLRDNAEVLTAMMGLLTEYFHPETGCMKGEACGDIAIQSHRGGSKLSHSHHQHYFYVLESLTLWRCIMQDIFSLWSTAEDDMLDKQTSYRLRNTGQGLHRMKSADRTYQAMHRHIASAQREMSKVGSTWVGSKIVHLGDDVCSFLRFPLHPSNKNKITGCPERACVHRQVHSGAAYGDTYSQGHRGDRQSRRAPRAACLPGGMWSVLYDMF